MLFLAGFLFGALVTGTAIFLAAVFLGTDDEDDG